ncbi:MAG: neutral zinc metallopeptidase, partial [Candidatus Eremiobacteraeota bacterium]|nr:neutral zinc metallopeptidase [Candidatus Eremiobacteraeota bacterium]
MRWQGRRGSENVEDLRGGGGGGRPLRAGGLVTVVVVVVALMAGVDPFAILQALAGSGPPSRPAVTAPDGSDEFASVVLADTEEVWHQLFAERGMTYVEPKLVLFDGEVSSACGFAQAAMGPFYCPGDEKVYLDLSFFQELEQRFGAPGDFARAYVIAHEVGHHVQDQFGVLSEVHQAQRGMSKKEANALQVKVELQ